MAKLIFFRPTPSWLPPGRYTRSIVAKDGLRLSCRAVNLSIATKVLVVDLYAVQYAVPARKPKTQNKPQKQTGKNKQNNKPTTKTHKQNKNKTTKKHHFFPSNAFMASARSLHIFIRGKQLNCSLHAGLSPCRKLQKCRLWTSTQSRNCSSKRTGEQESKPKTTQQKQEKHTTKTKTKQKRQREVRSQPAMGITCMMTSYVSF